MDSHSLDYNSRCVRALNVTFSSKKKSSSQIFPGKVKIKLGSQTYGFGGKACDFWVSDVTLSGISRRYLSLVLKEKYSPGIGATLWFSFVVSLVGIQGA